MTLAERVSLRVAVFAAGALLMALEVAAFRIIGKTFGSALRETTTVIAVFLAAMSVGYWAGGRVADRWPRPVTLVVTLVGATLTLLFVPWIDASLSPKISASSLALSAHAFLATTILFAIPTFLLAATSPIAIRLFTTSAVESGSTAGSISALSTVGSIVGSVATAFLLIDWLESITRTVLFVALGTCATALLVVLASAGTSATGGVRRLLSTLAALSLMGFLTMAFVRSTRLDQSLVAELPGTRILFLGDSPYHHILVRQRGPWRDLQFNIGIQSRMRVDDPAGPGLTYTNAVHVGPALRPGIRRVLMIGLGGGTLPKQFLRFYPEATIDVVEIDPMVVKVARQLFHLPEDERLRIHVADGRAFIKHSTEKWDLVVVDAYTTNRYGDTVPPHLTTQEFFQEIARHLNEGGIVHYHCLFATSPLMSSVERTLASVFPHLARVRGELIASPQPLDLRKEELARLAATSPARVLPAFASQMTSVVPQTPPEDALILTDDYAPVDTLMLQK